MGKKRNIYIFSILVLFLVLLFIYIKEFAAGTKLWGIFNQHELIEIYDTVPGEKYNNSYEAIFYGEKYGTIPWHYPLACMASPGFEYSQLFGSECGFIFFGTVLQCDNYAFTDTYDGEYDIDFTCHTIKLRVEKDIYGNLEEGREVYIFCRWQYNPEEDCEGDNSIEEGKKGIFITTGLPARLNYKNGKDILAIGSMHNNKRFHYCLSSYADGLDKLETKQDVIDFWDKNHWFYNEKAG